MNRVRPVNRVHIQRLIPAAAGIPEAGAALGGCSLGGGVEDEVAMPAAAGGEVVLGGVVGALEGV